LPSIPAETASGEFTEHAQARVTHARLTLVYPPDAHFSPSVTAKTILLDTTPRILGRLAEHDAEVAIPHRTISRRHLELRWDPAAARHLVRDLGSRNGSALHGRPLAQLPRALDDNAVLRLGDVLAVYERQHGPALDGLAVDRRAIPGDALSILSFRAAIARAAADPSPVLLIGESGSGKERSAAELHRLSGRRGPLITLNCAALSPHLIESQLFGHQRGAFTGATAAQVGLFRAADGGTLFLDEIGELPLDLQPKLLRALESGEVLPLGTTAHQRVDVRIIAATNRELARAVEAGAFRRDLYARLALWELALPPIARRRVDILPWLARLAAAWSQERARPPLPALDLSPAAAAHILCHRWPDNLRGLHRLIHELAHLAGTRVIGRDDLPSWLIGQVDENAEHGEPAASPAAALVPPELRPRPSRSELLAALIAHDWNLTATARAYGRDRKQISRWIAMYEIAHGAP
jgi:DNA-binding NtrC family response regulator